MTRFPALMLLLACPCGAAAEPVTAETEARAWLESQADYVVCADQRFVYGVGYIDGSYMERIFLAADSGGKPQIEIRFRNGPMEDLPHDADIPPLPFVMEIRLGRVLQAVPSGASWVPDGPGWTTSLRFKYTSWFGSLSRTGGQWKVAWSGYRKPMLPHSLLADPRGTCALFDAPG